ncbi:MULTISPECIES: hypothetical protein [unclassified Mucilaginibacter]|uniref:hypothetical protein n=1 Tax=unclassified Mucilaginibacter TaxID=2617802 RepID=UPI0031F6A1C4
MNKFVLTLAAAMALSATQSFAQDKGKKKCGGDCCKKEAKAATLKKTNTAVKKA